MSEAAYEKTAEEQAFEAMNALVSDETVSTKMTTNTEAKPSKCDNRFNQHINSNRCKRRCYNNEQPHIIANEPLIASQSAGRAAMYQAILKKQDEMLISSIFQAQAQAEFNENERRRQVFTQARFIHTMNQFQFNQSQEISRKTNLAKKAKLNKERDERVEGRQAPKSRKRKSAKPAVISSDEDTDDPKPGCSGGR